jgi:hypothetical protein
MEEKRSAWSVLVGKPYGRGHLEDPGMNLITDFREVVLKNVIWIKLA